jgi:hypothetical protein
MRGSDRYAFVPVSSAGLLLDLESGAVFRLNSSAAFVWRLRQAGHESTDIARALASRYGIEETRACVDVATALAPTAELSSPARSISDYLYRASDTGYVQFLREEPMLQVDAQGERLRVIAPMAARNPRRLNNCLRAIAPKVLSLRGRMVLHASAVLVAGRLLIFPGPSGAGKTTTARALVSQGATAVSEDKVLVDVDGAAAFAWVMAESAIDRWVTYATTTLLSGGEALCDALNEATEGPLVPIAEIGFIDAGRRSDAGLTARLVEGPDAAAQLFRWTFLGSAGPAHWRRDLELAAAISDFAVSYELTMPSDLPALGFAAAGLATRATLAS